MTYSDIPRLKILQFDLYASFYEWTTTPYDNNNILRSDRDAARQNWGSGWRMPTKAEFEELCNNTTSTWTDNYNNTGVKGRVFTSTKTGYTDKSIFFPAGGNIHEHEGEDNGYYWSNQIATESIRSYCLLFEKTGTPSTTEDGRCVGLLVRPVR